jgi:hypothetical protein
MPRFRAVGSCLTAVLRSLVCASAQNVGARQFVDGPGRIGLARHTVDARPTSELLRGICKTEFRSTHRQEC